MDSVQRTYQTGSARPNSSYQEEHSRIFTPYQKETNKKTTPYQSNPSNYLFASGIKQDQLCLLADRPPSMWGKGPQVPERATLSNSFHPSHHSTNLGGVAKAEKEVRRLDPRMKYAHLKIKPKGSSSSTSLSSSISKKTQREDVEGGLSTFQVPKLLQNPSALNKPINSHNLFKNSNSSEAHYGEGADGCSVLFKSNFFSSEIPSQDSTDDCKSKQFGEITLEQNTPTAGNVDTNFSELVVEESTATKIRSNSLSENTDNISESTEPQVPSYFANLIQLHLQYHTLQLHTVHD